MGTGTRPGMPTRPTAEAQFAAYFDQIVTAMRTVAGENFQFVWNPDVGAFTKSGYNVALAYPGNGYVNDIGLDAYDETWVTPQTPTNAWNETTQPALTAARTFAAAQGKPLAICEWGIAFLSNGHGLGDDPLYVNNFATWMKTRPTTWPTRATSTTTARATPFSPVEALPTAWRLSRLTLDNLQGGPGRRYFWHASGSDCDSRPVTSSGVRL